MSLSWDSWDKTGTDGVGVGKIQSFAIPERIVCPRCGSNDLTRKFTGIYYSPPADTVACNICNQIFDYKRDYTNYPLEKELEQQ